MTKLLIIDTDRRISWGEFFIHKWFKYEFVDVDRIKIHQIAHNKSTSPINIPNSNNNSKEFINLNQTD